MTAPFSTPVDTDRDVPALQRRRFGCCWPRRSGRCRPGCRRHGRRAAGRGHVRLDRLVGAAGGAADPRLCRCRGRCRPAVAAVLTSTRDSPPATSSAPSEAPAWCWRQRSVACRCCSCRCSYGSGTTNLQARYAGADLATSQRRGRAVSTVLVATTLGAVAGPNLVEPMGSVATALGIPELAGPFLLATAAYALAGVVVSLQLRPDPLLTARAIAHEAAHAAAAGGTTAPASTTKARCCCGSAPPR